MRNVVARALILAELLALLWFAPFIATGLLWIGGGSTLIAIPLFVSWVSAIIAWGVTYVFGFDYVRRGSVSFDDWSTPRWKHLSLYAPLPSAIFAGFFIASPPKHADGLDALTLALCLIWIPMLHLELLRWLASQANYRLERRAGQGLR